MLIGQFCETYPPEMDGVGRVMLCYCQTLARMGHRCPYIAPDHPHHREPVPCETILYNSLPLGKELYRIGFPSLSPRFRRDVASLPFDILHTHSPFLIGHAALRIAKRRRVPLVATFHSKYYDDVYKATHSRVLSRAVVRYIIRLYAQCDEVWTVNERTADVLRGYGFRGEIVVMPNGTDYLTVDDDDRARAQKRFPLRADTPTLIFAGQQDLKKNLDGVLRACALLRDEGLDFQLVMAGDGTDIRFLQALTRELGLEERTVYTGFIKDRGVLLSLYERADLLVFPSLYDNAPMVVREAAAMGTPALLVADSCSAEGIEHGVNGYLCENTAESIAESIRAALPSAREVGLRARATIPLPWDKLLPRVLARYEALIAAKKQTERKSA